MNPKFIRHLTIPAALLAGVLLVSPRAQAVAAAADRPAIAAAGATADSGRRATAPALPPAPLFIDTADMGFGESVVYRRVPNSADIAALAYYDNVQHIVLALPAWPEDWAAIQPLGKVLLPQGTDLVLILPGYPQTHAQAEVWNMLRQPMRIIMLVNGPPVDRGMILELNSLRGLERIIATMVHPSRSGFERLQRPLAFRVEMP